MFKRLLKFLLRLILYFVFLVIVIVVIAAFTMGPRVKENSALVLELTGPLMEMGPQNWKERFLFGEVLTTRDVVNSLEKAKKDNRIKALVVRSLWAQMGIGKAQEIRTAIRDFAHTAKKPVYGFVEDGATVDYYVCSAAPKVYMPPDGSSWFTLLGLRAEMPFAKGTLSKLGIEGQFDHIGTYKSGSDMYTRESMSDPDREAINSLLDSLYDRLTSDIAHDRNLPKDNLRKLIDQAPFIGQELKQKHLIDDLLYRDQLNDKIKKEAHLKELNEISVLEYQKPTFREAIDEKENKIGIIYAIGSIMPGESTRGWGEDIIGSTTIAEALHQAREDNSVKAVVFRVDSPGGSPSASDLIWQEVKITAQKKPVVVSMADVAASGGYYISMGSSKIFADPSTITGSIGVYGGKFYLKGLYDKIGMNKEIIKRGKHADLFSDYVPFDEEKWGIVRRQMQFTYDAFTRKAAEGRKRTLQQIQSAAEGRVWTGDQGVQLGLVDRIGGLKEAIEEAKNLAKLGGKEVGFTIYPAPKGGLTDMFSSSYSRVQLPATLNRILLWAQIAEKEHVLLLMPYQFSLN